LDANIGWTKFFSKLDFQGALIKLEEGRIDIREMLLYFNYG